MFSYGFCQISKNTYFTEQLRATASYLSYMSGGFWDKVTDELVAWCDVTAAENYSPIDGDNDDHK